MTDIEGSELRRSSRRLAIQFGVILLVFLGLVAGVTFAAVRAGQKQSETRSLSDAAQVMEPQDAPRGILVAIQSKDDFDVSKGAPSWFPIRSEMKAIHEDTVVQQPRVEDGRSYIVRTSSDDGRVVQVALDTHEDIEELGRLGLALGAASLIAMIAAIFVAAAMARRAMRPMVEALALQRRFVMDASHELRTPLTLLSTRVQMLRRSWGGTGQPVARSDAGQGLDEILRHTQELGDILEDLLIAADPRETAELRAVDLGEIGRQAVADRQDLAAEKQVVLAWSSSAVPAVVNGSPASLARLFAALISNALDHADSRIDVSVTTEGGNAAIRVADDGLGFSPDVRSHAFERFASTRAGAAPEGRERHYGLGLALVAEVATRHGGSVKIEPQQPDTGAIVTVQIPIVSA